MAENLGSIRICEFRMPKMTLNTEKGKAGMLFGDFLKELGICEETANQFEALFGPSNAPNSY